MTATAYPLDWPIGWKRTAVRTRAKFGRGVQQYRTEVQNGVSRQVPSYTQKTSLTIEQATRRVRDELKRFGVSDWDVIISTNLQLRNDGMPRSGQANPRDPGAAVYWKKAKDTRCMAIDRYDRVADNLAAIAATLDAMRAIERHGGATILDRAFTGFVALPAPEQPFQVLGVGANASKEEIERAYRKLAGEHHPDRGGDEQQMSRINAARDALLEQHP
jgi:DnaJ domain